MNPLNLKEPFSQMVINQLNLKPDQVDQLINPQHIVMRDQAIVDVANYIQDADKLMICGDFDADGVTSTSIAALIAEHLNIPYGYYIPNRIEEGYGTSVRIIEMAYEKGYTDILMIDNGVKAFDAIDKAQALGLRVGIVDHHLIDKALDVDAFLHPDFLSDYGQSMSAAGLMYLIAEYLGLNDDLITALAAIGTIADVMPLWYKNREIVQDGVRVLNQKQIASIDAIANRNSYTLYSAQFLAFQVIPKINSIGRMSDLASMNTMVQFFLSNDVSTIKSYTQQMFKINETRKQLSSQMTQLAMSLINPEDHMNVIAHESFHEGILGIIANQVLQVTGKPTVIMKPIGEIYKGSSRSGDISLSDLYRQLDTAYFKALGGHDFAFGLSLYSDSFESFKSDVNQIVPQLEKHEVERVLDVDINLLTKESLIELKQYEPFGEGFQIPKVRVKLPNEYTISPIKEIGFKMVFKNTSVDEAVVFGKGITMDDLQQAQAIEGTVSYNSFRKVSIMIDAIVSI